MQLCHLYSEEPFYPKLQEFIRRLYCNKYKELGWDKKENEKDTDSLLRNSVISMMIKANDKDAKEEAIKRYKEYMISKDTNIFFS